jgi:hypothetical protein
MAEPRLRPVVDYALMDAKLTCGAEVTEPFVTAGTEVTGALEPRTLSTATTAMHGGVACRLAGTVTDMPIALVIR